MEMHQIRYFLAVARTLNFTHAADECHVAQPSLSRAIKKLEEELGGDLFRRERSLTHLTDLGRMMLPLLVQSYESAQSAKSLAASFRKSGCAPLRLALSGTIHMGMMVEPLTELVKAFPGLELSFTRGSPVELVETLKADGAELAVAGQFVDSWDRLDVWPLFVEPFELVVSRLHRLAQRNAITLDALADERLLARDYCEGASDLALCLQRHGIVQTSGDRIACDQDALALVEANVGVSIVPSTTQKSAGIRAIRIEGAQLQRTVCLYGVSGRMRSPAANALIKLLRTADWSNVSPVLKAARADVLTAGSKVASANMSLRSSAR